MTRPRFPFSPGCGVIILCALTACGYTDEGEGSETLRVTATAHYLAGEANLTTARIDVADASASPITGASITLADGDDKSLFDVPAVDPTNNPGIYEVTFDGYHRRLALSITAGSHRLSAQLEGPGTHIIESPVNGAVVSRSSLGDQVEVTWVTKDGLAADEIVLTTTFGKFLTTHQEDSGSHTIPADKLADGPEEIRLLRRNRISLAGGLGNSTFEIGYEVGNSMTVE